MSTSYSDVFVEQGSNTGQTYDDSQGYYAPFVRYEDTRQHIDANQQDHLGGRQHKAGRSRNKHRREAKKNIEEFEKVFDSNPSQR